MPTYHFLFLYEITFCKFQRTLKTSKNAPQWNSQNSEMELFRSQKGNFILSKASNPSRIDYYGALQVGDEDGSSFGDELACQIVEHDMWTFSIPRGCNPP